MAGHAGAFPFGEPDGIQGFWTTTVTAGAGFRTRGPDPMLIKRENGILLGIPGASGGGADDANLNYPSAGDNYSTVGKVFTDLDLRYRNFGVAVRGKLWYDERLSDRGVPHGNTNNGYVPGARLSDAGFEDEARFSGATLASAFAYGTFRLGDTPVDVRLGQQAVLSGLGIGRYLRGISLNMPIDVPAVRRIGYLEPLPLSLPMNVYDPYVQKYPAEDTRFGVAHDESRMALWRALGSNTGYWDPEAPIPTGALSGNVGLPYGASLNAFYQYQWRPTVFAPCGTYFSPNDLNTDRSASTTCFAVQYGQVDPLNPTAVVSEQQALAQRRYIRMIGEQLPSNGGQYGATLWFPVPVALPNGLGGPVLPEQKPLQIGLHFLSMHATVPVLNGIRGQPGSLYEFQPRPAQGRWVYPENIRTYGISARIDPAAPRGWMLNAELSYVPDAPLQINANDLLYGSVTAGAGPAGPRVVSVPIGQEVKGYDSVGKTQLIVNGGIGFDKLLGVAVTGFLFGEVGAQWAGIPDNGMRYGRAFMYGIAPAPGVAAPATICVQAPGNVGCENEGYFTHFAWGFRLKSIFNFEKVAYGWSVRPSVAYSQDVNGYSIDNQLAKGRKWLELTLRLDTQSGGGQGSVLAPRYYVDLRYVTFDHGAKFDSLRDRDYFYAVAGITF